MNRRTLVRNLLAALTALGLAQRGSPNASADQGSLPDGDIHLDSYWRGWDDGAEAVTRSQPTWEHIGYVRGLNDSQVLSRKMDEDQADAGVLQSIVRAHPEKYPELLERLEHLKAFSLGRLTRETAS